MEQTHVTFCEKGKVQGEGRIKGSDGSQEPQKIIPSPWGVIKEFTTGLHFANWFLELPQTTDSYMPPIFPLFGWKYPQQFSFAYFTIVYWGREWTDNLFFQFHKK